MKCNQTMNFQLIKSLKREIFFFNNHAEKETGRLFPGLFLKKALYEVKTTCLQLSFSIL